MKNDDRVDSVNGIRILDPTTGADAFLRLRTADHLAVSLLRKGTLTTLNVDIR